MQSKSPTLIITFYFQISSACSKSPKLHNFHYKCVWIQITVSCFQEASQKLNLPSSAALTAVISLADHRQKPFHQCAGQTFQRLACPVALVTFCGNMQFKVKDRDGSAQISPGRMSFAPLTASALPEYSQCTFPLTRQQACWEMRG